MEPPICKDIRRLKPLLAQGILVMLETLKHEGFRPFVLETYRTPERAKWLVAHGRGAILKSKHCLGEACDVGFKTKEGACIWDNDYPGWDRLMQLCKKRGLVHGHGWKSVDSPHVEMKS